MTHKQNNTQSYLKIACFEDVVTKHIEPLWPARIACGKLTVIAGNPGLGKSQITISFAATVSKGGCWPNAEGKAPLGNVIILSAEDDAADTIKPRLVAAGADLSRCYIIEAVKIVEKDKPDKMRGFDFTQDIEGLQKVINKIGDVRLVIIDPISAYLGKTDSNNNSEMRGLLAMLSAIATTHNAAFILLTHLNKSTQQDAIGRIIGSVGLIAAARAGYAVSKDEKNPELRYFLPVKNNIGNDKNGFAFKIESVTLPDGVKTSKIDWQSDLVEAHPILHPASQKKSTATSAAAEFLQELMSDGPMLAERIFEEAEGAGYSKSSMQRAKSRLGIKQRKLGMKEGWEWYAAPTSHTFYSRNFDKHAEDSEGNNFDDTF